MREGGDKGFLVDWAYQFISAIEGGEHRELSIPNIEQDAYDHGNVYFRDGDDIVETGLQSNELSESSEKLGCGAFNISLSCNHQCCGLKLG